MPGRVTFKLGVHGPELDDPTDFNTLIAGAGSFTNTVAVEVFPVPPFVELTVTELVLSPTVLPVTLTVIVQVEPAAKLAPLKLTEDEPAVAVAVPPQVFVNAGVAETSKPLGRESVNPTPVNAVAALGLLMDRVNVVEFPVKIGLAVKDLLITGGSITVRAA